MKSVALPDELATAVNEIARASGKTPDQVVEDATRRYAHALLDSFVDRNYIRTRELGVTEDEVPGIGEWGTK
jgi:predicted transcriptional regulator